ncbi:nucleotidyltransferase substrate binding protein [Ectothiorhodospira haloalkaliphila]|uniref:nucleotidyltransferase substrate binding protein n=1 Tax=Ectothiorhodospira TaxID=1051 RepID=UPI001EE9807A|nr:MULTISPECIES: nucleotidyltransferase substrate binding protein [Ectothiorhodospira]MCG5496968.1 nucleotidyltransferase substrate binding protein [Ectothiorhodospira variabilis]MCG5525111.1 nucleotidyltransferase substrate binding protein [Ectothiorhodospira haloalkaliphila]
MNDQDIRWQQRFANFNKAHAQLLEALELMEQRPLSKLEKQGTIQAFEFTYELAWNLLRDYILWQGDARVSGSRDAIREAFNRQLISDGHGWMAMLQDRNRTVHTYNEATANEILAHVRQRYAALFRELAQTFAELAHDQKSEPGGH